MWFIRIRTDSIDGAWIENDNPFYASKCVRRYLRRSVIGWAYSITGERYYSVIVNCIVEVPGENDQNSLKEWKISNKWIEFKYEIYCIYYCSSILFESLSCKHDRIEIKRKGHKRLEYKISPMKMSKLKKWKTGEFLTFTVN